MRPLPLALALALSCGCSSPRFAFTPSVGAYGVEGTVVLDDTGPGSANSLDALGLGHPEHVASGRFDVRWGGPHLSATTTEASFRGTGATENAIQRGGGVLGIGEAIDSQARIGLRTAVWTWDLAPAPAFELGLGAGLTDVALEARFAAVSGLGQVDVQEDAVAPLLALRAGASRGDLGASVLLSTTALDTGEVDGALVDLDLMLRYGFLEREAVPAGWLTLGWRRVDLDLTVLREGDRAATAFALSGPYIGLSFGF